MLTARITVDLILADRGDVLLATKEFCRCVGLAGLLGMAI
jgi:hypothetical protein